LSGPVGAGTPPGQEIQRTRERKPDLHVQITELASSTINGTDSIVDRVNRGRRNPGRRPHQMAAQATVLHPRRFPDSAAVIARLFAEAATALARIKASKRL
jgi:hypothetical protein